MPGIEDVQPKQINTSPLSPIQIAPAANTSVMTDFVNAFRTGIITANDIADRFGPEAVAKRKLAQEMISPEAVEARKQAQLSAAAKSAQERETSLTKDFVDAYMRYNLPLKKSDGSFDYSGMAEVGQKYADSERVMKYAELGVKGTPVQSLDPKTGKQITRFYNAFGEDITEGPGEKNTTLREYQKMLRDTRSFLLKNNDEPEVPEGGTAPIIQVTPKAINEMQAPVLRPVPPVITPPVENPNDPGQARAWLFSSQAIPQSQAVNLTDAEALNLYKQYQVPAAPVIEAKTAPVSAPVSSAVVPKTPAVTEPRIYAGQGIVTGPGTFDADKFMSTDIRGSGLYKNWEEKAPFIGDLRGIVKKYESLPPGSITTQNDIALATAALMLATPGSSAGGRGMEGMRLTKLEDSQPLLEQLYGIKGHLFKEHKFEEGTRKRIIEAAERKARVLEDQGRSALANARNRLIDQGLDPDNYLFGQEKELLSGTPPGAVEAQPSVRANTIRLPSGRVVVGRATTLR